MLHLFSDINLSIHATIWENVLLERIEWLCTGWGRTSRHAVGRPPRSHFHSESQANGCNLTLPPCFQLWDWVVSGEWVLAVDQWLCVPEREIESMCGSMSQASRSFSAREAHVHPLEPHLFSGMLIAGATQAFVHGLLLFYRWICFIIFRGV